MLSRPQRGPPPHPSPTPTLDRAASLKRLGLEYVDLIYCHRPDPETPIEETVRAMNWVGGAGVRAGGAGPRGWATRHGCDAWLRRGEPAFCHQGCARSAHQACPPVKQQHAARAALWLPADHPCARPPPCAGAGPGHGLLLGHQRVVPRTDRGGLGRGRPAGTGGAGCASPAAPLALQAAGSARRMPCFLAEKLCPIMSCISRPASGEGGTGNSPLHSSVFAARQSAPRRQHMAQPLTASVAFLLPLHMRSC